jgi:hypothetical protein
MADAQEAVDDKVLLGTTKGGKDIYLTRKRGISVRFIAFGDGGQLPENLQGGFSSIKSAQDTVDVYLASESKKPTPKKATTRGSNTK